MAKPQISYSKLAPVGPNISSPASIQHSRRLTRSPGLGVGAGHIRGVANTSTLHSVQYTLYCTQRALYCAHFALQCTHNTTQFSLHTSYCTCSLYSAHYKTYSLDATLHCTIWCTLHTLHCTIWCILHPLHCTVYFMVYTTYFTMYTVHCSI